MSEAVGQTPVSGVPATVVVAVPALSAAPAAPAAALETPAPLSVTPPAAAPLPPVEENVEVVYSPTGDSTLDLALGFVGRLGFGPERPEIKAATTGDFAPLAAALEKLGDKAKGYKPYLAAAKESHTRVVGQRKAAEDSTTKAVVEAAGGTAAWNAIHAWVVAEADDKQKAEINAAFAGGPTAAVAMTQYLANLYKQSGKSTLPPKGVVKPDAGNANGADSEGALSPQQFKDAMRTLEARFGSRTQSRPEYEDLRARRRAYQPK